jgi:hypothetical protein
MFDRHELPSRITRCSFIGIPGTSQNTPDAIRTYDLDLDLATSSMRYPNFYSNMFQCFKIILRQRFACNCHRALDAIGTDGLPALICLVPKCTVVELDRMRYHPSLWFDEIPCLRCFHILVSVEYAVAIFIAE